MKKIIWIIVIILAIVGAFTFTNDKALEESTDLVLFTLLQNSEPTVLDNMYALWSEEERTDMAVILVSDTEGTGTFYNLAIFDVQDDIFTKKSEVFLGDRIKITRVGIGELVHSPDANYRVTVQTLVRGEGEPFTTEPTLPQTKTFYVTDQILEEVEVGRDDT
ncbi:hypothetical protein HN375_00865 [bacterium]|nr:hypothetical protein [bacterium]